MAGQIGPCTWVAIKLTPVNDNFIVPKAKSLELGN